MGDILVVQSKVKAAAKKKKMRFAGEAVAALSKALNDLAAFMDGTEGFAELEADILEQLDEGGRTLLQAIAMLPDAAGGGETAAVVTSRAGRTVLNKLGNHPYERRLRKLVLSGRASTLMDAIHIARRESPELLKQYRNRSTRRAAS